MFYNEELKMTKKNMKVIAFNYLTDTPVTHILEVFTRLQEKYDVELTLLNTLEKSNITKLANDVKICHVPLTQYKVPFFKGLWFEIYIILHFLISREKIDIIYGRLRPFSFAEYVLWKLKKIPVVIEVNGILTEEILMEIKAPSFLNPLILKIVSFLEGKTLSVAKKVFAVTPNIKSKIQEVHNIEEDKVFVIENGANTDLFKPIAKEKAKEKLHLNYKNQYITFIGNLAPWQGVEYLVKAAPIILNEIPDIKFLIVGDGAMRQELQEMVDKLNVQDSFIFTGMVPYEDVPLYVNAGELCVAYKIPIGSGYSALKFYEYMACGKPIVGSRVTGFEILEQYNSGVLVEPQNHEKLANEIIKLLKNEKLREQMGKNGRKYLIENNSWDAVTKRISSILDNIY